MTETTPPSQPAGRQTSAAGGNPRVVAGGIREVLVLAYPVILTQISMTTMGIVDSAMVGSLGATELGAVGFGGIWLWTVVCFFVGTMTGVQTFVSQREGAGALRECGAWTWQGVYALAPMGLLATAILYFSAPDLMRLLGPSEELQPLASRYLSVRSLGMLGILGAVAISSFFRGIGDTRTPLYATVIANIANAVLDYGLIFGEFGLPRLEVTGAATATAISEWLYLAAMIVPFCRPRIRERYQTHYHPPQKSEIRRLLRTGAPIGGQWWLEMVSFAAFTTLVARMGDASMAASQAFVALLSISFMQATGLATAVQTLVGQYIGSQQLAYAERSFRSGLQLTVYLAGAIAILFYAVPDLLVGIFTEDPEVIRLAGPLLLVGGLFQFFDCFGIVADGALRGGGDTRWPFAVRFALGWLLFLPLAYWLGIVLEGGLTWAWAAGVVEVALLSSTLIWRFRTGAWKHIVI